MHTVDALVKFAAGYSDWAYILFFVGMIFEGEFILLMAGILAHLGVFNFFAALAVGLAGGFSKSFGWYAAGGIIKKYYPKSKFLKFVEKKVLYVLPNFKIKPFWSIFVSKFFYGVPGVHHFVLILCGYLKLKFKTYFKAEVASSTIWVTGLILLGYFLSFAAVRITTEIKRFLIIIIAAIIVFSALEHFVGLLYQLWGKWNNNGNIDDIK